MNLILSFLLVYLLSINTALAQYLTELKHNLTDYDSKALKQLWEEYPRLM